jgi:SdrD B-like domain
VAVDSGHSAPTAGLPAQDTTVVRLAAYGGGDLTSRLSIDGNVQWATAVQGRAAPSTSADVSLTYQLARSWELLFTYYENRIGSWTPLTVTSPLTPPVPTPQASQGQQGIFLTLRWQQSRGGHFVPLGGAPGAGSGRLTGVVYLDANENGRYDAGEAGAPNVTVILDGRFSTRTDTNGRFDFPAVVAGHHVVTVQSDNLALPWTLVNQGRTEVDVTTRDRIDVNIAAVRLK